MVVVLWRNFELIILYSSFLSLDVMPFFLQGVQYVIYWKDMFSKYAACHFRHALFSVIQR